MARRQREQYITINIYVEGRKTEQIYFNNYTRQINSSQKYRLNVKYYCSDLKKTIDYIDDEIRDSDKNDVFYFVFDTDRTSESELIGIYTNMQSKNIKCELLNNEIDKINLIYSTPCFEYWFLLHYKKCTDSFGDCSGVISKLNNYIVGYDKAKDYFDMLLDKQMIAIQNAKWVETDHKTQGHVEFTTGFSPHTSVYLLVELLNKFNEV